MKIAEITSELEQIAPPLLQESYDNAGLILGNSGWACTGVMISLDATEEIVQEAIDNNCNLIVAHHPIIFKGLKKINGDNYIEKAIIKAIKNDIAIYAIHTNLDNVFAGVNGKMAEIIGLQNTAILQPKNDLLKKMVVYIPEQNLDEVRNALFTTGAGHIGAYSECSYAGKGTGSFKAGESAQPYVGNIGERHFEEEIRLELVFPAWLKGKLIAALKQVHPYEEPAFDVISLENRNENAGSGITGELPKSMDEVAFLQLLKEKFGLSMIRHTALLGKRIKKVALCGGAGSFLINKAVAVGADIYISGDIKYHEFFDANNRLVIADIGHFESEQYTIDLLFDILKQKFPTFAVLKTRLNTNPVKYF
jgi:dinuclear metal center YbgI/SA1388 family protein